MINDEIMKFSLYGRVLQKSLNLRGINEKC